LTSKQKYIASAPNHLPVFAQAFWLDAVAPNWDVWHFSLNNIDFYLPFVVEKKGPFTFIRNIIATPYSSIYSSITHVDNAIWQQVYNAFHVWCSQFSVVELDQHFLYPSVANHPQINTVAIHTNVLDTRLSIDDLKKNTKSSLQRHLKFAEKNITITQCNDIETIFNIIQSTANIKKIKNIYTKPLLQNIIDTCAKNNCGIAWQALDAQGKTHGILLQVWDAQASYSVIAATLYPQNMRGVMPALLWRAILQTKQKNIPNFDFEGSRIIGIDTFFKTFGGMEKQVMQINMQNSKIVKGLMMVKKWMGK
jgi:hypothetical protein